MESMCEKRLPLLTTLKASAETEKVELPRSLNVNPVPIQMGKKRLRLRKDI